MATVATPTPTCKPANVVRLRQPVGPHLGAPGEILINGKAYLLGRHSHGFRLGGYNAAKDEGTCYDIPLDCSSCDCPDATYRQREGGCKHQRAIRALLNAGKLD